MITGIGESGRKKDSEQLLFHKNYRFHKDKYYALINT